MISVADPLGPGRHGSIHASHHGVRRSCRDRRWGRSLPDVQPRHPMATPDAEVPQVRPRSPLSVWAVASPLRILEVTEIKTVPYVPLSHAFVERLIGTIRREYLDRTLFWTTADLQDKLLDFRTYFNDHRSHAALQGRTSDQDLPMPRPVANLHSYGWQGHCRGLYHTPMGCLILQRLVLPGVSGRHRQAALSMKPVAA
jgi:hypothetical protein